LVLHLVLPTKLSVSYTFKTKGVTMYYINKAITWAKANKSLAAIGVIVVLGVLSNLLGFS